MDPICLFLIFCCLLFVFFIIDAFMCNKYFKIIYSIGADNLSRCNNYGDYVNNDGYGVLLDLVQEKKFLLFTRYSIEYNNHNLNGINEYFKFSVLDKALYKCLDLLKGYQKEYGGFETDLMRLAARIER